MTNQISIIIPVLNEEAHLGRLLQHLEDIAAADYAHEIIVVDGGSSDGSQQIVAGFPKVRLLKSPKGRAKQMNLGAQHASGELLYFLHADTFPPQGFDRQIIAKAQLGHAGCFRLKFDHPNHFLLKLAPLVTRFHSNWFRGGDQSLFIRKKQFEALNGFNEAYLVYEDVEFIERIYQQYDFEIIKDYVTTSARKFERIGTLRLYLYFLMIHIKYRQGVGPVALSEYYKWKIGQTKAKKQFHLSN
ncbi:MAG: TIGR04283 family arsenosugar biosynthesis glycosyltransferase [Bacteroidota bacterium]